MLPVKTVTVRGGSSARACIRHAPGTPQATSPGVSPVDRADRYKWVRNWVSATVAAWASACAPAASAKVIPRISGEPLRPAHYEPVQCVCSRVQARVCIRFRVLSMTITGC